MLKRNVWADFRDILAGRRWLLALGLLFMTINRFSGLVLPYSTRYLIDDVIGKAQHYKLLPMILLLAGATVLQALTGFATTKLVGRMGDRLVFELRKKVQAHIGVLPISFYESNKVGALVSRIMADIGGIRNLVGGPMLEFLGGIITTVLSICVLFFISPPMTCLVVVFVVAFTYVARKAFAIIRPMQREEGRLAAEVAGRLTESLGGIRVVKSYRAEARESEAFTTRLKRLLERELATVNAVSRMNLLAVLVAGLLGALIWFIGIRTVIHGSMTVGTLLTFIAFLAYLVTPIVQSVSNGIQIAQVLAGLDRTRELLNEIPEDQDQARTLSIPSIQGDLDFEQVCFSYKTGKPVLHDISFQALAGTITALVGPSGSGKSTLISLLAAFHKPERGRVLVDGIDLSKVRLDSFRTQLGVVLQETFLFDGTIAENIAFSRPSATREEITEACRVAHVEEFVSRLENQYETIVGERGLKLSGGQRQRVSIARAVLANPRILILDEATSSLDSESEDLIQQGLKFLMNNRTTVVIAHRLSTIRQADQIIVLDQGRIVERGTHESLCCLGKRYWDMYSRQVRNEENLLMAARQRG